MKKLLHFLILTLLMGCSSSNNDLDTSTEQEQRIGFNDTLAQKLGADDYGMRQYVMAFLKAGPKRNQDSATAAQLQADHLKNIRRLAKAGKLSLAGPFLDNGNIRGIYIFNTSSLDSAEAWTATDPAIQAGSLIMELKPWYGSAALVQVNQIHKSLSKKSISK